MLQSAFERKKVLHSNICNMMLVIEDTKSDIFHQSIFIL